MIMDIEALKVYNQHNILSNGFSPDIMWLQVSQHACQFFLIPP